MKEIKVKIHTLESFDQLKDGEEILLYSENIWRAGKYEMYHYHHNLPDLPVIYFPTTGGGEDMHRVEIGDKYILCEEISRELEDENN